MPAHAMTSKRGPTEGHRRPFCWPLVLSVLLGVAGCVDLGAIPPDSGPEPDTGPIGPDGEGPVVEVLMSGLAFRPAEIDITVGTTVRWINYDAVAHTVTQGAPESTATPEWDSPLMGTNDVYERVFLTPAEWLYWCRTHPNIMRDCIVRVR